MAYTSGDPILDDEYNGFVANNSQNLNGLLGTGSGVRGYGQTTISTVSPGTTITATQWATILDKIDAIANHQGTTGSITVDSVTNPIAGDTIAIIANLGTDITTLDTNAANNVYDFGTLGYQTALTPASSTSTSTNFSGILDIAVDYQFSSNDEMRYFFNLGGKIVVTPSLSGGTADGKYNEWVDLTGTKMGAMTVFGNSSTRAGTGTLDVSSTQNGFHGITTTESILLKMFADTSPYTANYIELRGQILTTSVTDDTLRLRCRWVDDASDTSPSPLDIVDGTKTNTYQCFRPQTTYLTQSYTNPTIGVPIFTIS